MTLRCEYCDKPANSPSELFACEIKCAREDRETRGYYGRKNPNHRGI